MDNILRSLADIVDETHVSNRQEELFIYSFDLGTAEPRRPDYVVSPESVEQIQAILRLANRNKIPVVPLGGGLSLAGLAVPLKGGILIDLKRMDRIIEVNEKSRYAVLECGVSQANLHHTLKNTIHNLHTQNQVRPPQLQLLEI